MKKTFQKWMAEKHPIILSSYELAYVEWNNKQHLQRSRLITISLLFAGFLIAFLWGALFISGALCAMVIFIALTFQNVAELKKEYLSKEKKP